LAVVVPIITAVVTLITAVVTLIMTVVVTAFPIMPAVLATDVMTVDPLLAVMGPMTRDPSHFPVARPIASAMAVIGPVAYFDAEALRRNRGRENDARGRERCE
jgi:hypothetical protein